MRYIANTPDDRAAMLRDIGVSRFEDLLSSLPDSVRLKRPLNLPVGKSEFEVRTILSALARKNLHAADLVSFLGAGSYDHYVPAAVDAVAGRSEYVTAYTPYQPEVAQGTLQVIYEFQSMLCELFKMEAANASIYDGATALAEAVLLAHNQTRRPRVLWHEGVHPHYRQVTQTIAAPLGLQFETIPLTGGRVDAAARDELLSSDVAALVLQYPSFFGVIEEIEPSIQAAHKNGSLTIVVADPLAMGVLRPPGECGADIVVGEGQCLGNAQSYGGPYLGLFAATEKLVRRMPGRIVGVTRDADGKRGYVLTLQTREQHIRRDKATSNICTNEGLMATRATIYMSLLGPNGLRDIGESCLRLCQYLRGQLQTVAGVDLLFDGVHFKEFAYRLKGNRDRFLEYMANRRILAGVPLKRFHSGHEDAILVAVTENRTVDELDRYVAAVRAFLNEDI